MTAATIQNNEVGTVRKTRKKNAEVRSREYLHRHEVETLVAEAKRNKRGGDNPIGLRHALMVEMAFNHGLRAAEVVGIRWDDIDYKTGTIVIHRVKSGGQPKPWTHHLKGTEIRALKRLQAKNENKAIVFATERGGEMTTRGFHKLVAELGVKAGFSFPVHPHQLRHAKGFDLADKGTDVLLIKDYLGHVNIQNTMIYTKLAPSRVKGLEQ